MKVLMIGAGRNVKGSVSAVVNQYYEAKLDELVDLRYISTMEDGNNVKKIFIAFRAYMQFCSVLNEFDIVHVHMSSRLSFSRKSYFIRRAYKSNKRVIIHMHSTVS